MLRKIRLTLAVIFFVLITLLFMDFTRVECINSPDISQEEAMRPEVAERHIRQTVERLFHT